jgi:hypothetical protein
MKTDLMSELEFLQLLAEPGEGSFVLPDLYTAARILYIAVILKTGLGAAAADDVLPDSLCGSHIYQSRRSCKNEN